MAPADDFREWADAGCASLIDNALWLLLLVGLFLTALAAQP